MHALYDGPRPGDPLRAGHHQGHYQDQEAGHTVVDPEIVRLSLI